MCIDVCRVCPVCVCVRVCDLVLQDCAGHIFHLFRSKIQRDLVQQHRLYPRSHHRQPQRLAGRKQPRFIAFSFTRCFVRGLLSASCLFVLVRVSVFAVIAGSTKGGGIMRSLKDFIQTSVRLLDRGQLRVYAQVCFCSFRVIDVCFVSRF